MFNIFQQKAVIEKLSHLCGISGYKMQKLCMVIVCYTTWHFSFQTGNITQNKSDSVLRFYMCLFLSKGLFTRQVRNGTDLFKSGMVPKILIKKHPCCFGFIQRRCLWTQNNKGISLQKLCLWVPYHFLMRSIPFFTCRVNSP